MVQDPSRAPHLPAGIPDPHEWRAGAVDNPHPAINYDWPRDAVAL